MSDGLIMMNPVAVMYEHDRLQRGELATHHYDQGTNFTQGTQSHINTGTSSTNSRADFLGGRFGCGSTPRSSRHCARFCFLERFCEEAEVGEPAMKPSGRTWSKKRRMNSSDSSVIGRSRLAFLRFAVRESDTALIQ